MLSKTERKLFLLQDPVGLYKKDLIEMIPSDGADITFDPKKVGEFDFLGNHYASNELEIVYANDIDDNACNIF